MTTNFPSEDMAKNTVKIWSIMKSVGVAMMSVGNPHSDDATAGVNSRPMRARFEDKADVVWFIVPRSIFSSWAEGHQTLLTFSGGSHGDHVALQGEISEVEDRAKLKALWDGHADIMFPRGASDPEATLLCFKPSKATFWAGGSDIVSYVVNFLEAKVTGEAPTVGVHATVPPVAA